MSGPHSRNTASKAASLGFLDMCNRQSCCHVILVRTLDENNRKSYLGQMDPGDPGAAFSFSGNAYFFLPVAQTKSSGAVLDLAFTFTPYIQAISKSCWLCLLSKCIQEKKYKYVHVPRPDFPDHLIPAAVSLLYPKSPSCSCSDLPFLPPPQTLIALNV